MEADDVVVEQPALAVALVAVVATAVYVGLQVLLDGSVAPVETAIFTAVFTLVYVGGNYLLRRDEVDGGDDVGETEPDDEPQ